MSRRGGCKGQPIEQRLAEKLEPDLNSGCWLFSGYCYNTGYGRIADGDRFLSAHRVAYRLWNGPIGPDDHIRHTCDTRPCCNPAHLIAGPRLENIADAVGKGRHARGERHGQAVLNEQLVRMIRTSPKTATQLAAELGIGLMTVSNVRTRKSWAHVSDVPPPEGR